ncbi:MAG: thioredoxin domain-containing protein [Aureliella sp.]
MPNRLAKSSSPYLLQHKDNPVDWYEWGEDAFAKARRDDKPVFLSVGYSACHWCHVMEHESFENKQIAAILNQHFVAIKVDREERPDVDQIYMQAVQMMTGSGGWPMSVFMAADGKPFYGGTYWPPEPKFGRPGFGQVLLAIADAWKTKRSDLTQQGEKILEHLQAACDGPQPAGSLDGNWVTQAENWLTANYDREYGGFGNAPKFPHAIDIDLLIEAQALSPDDDRQAAIRTTLDNMMQGGIYDHLGGGFARYSVDRKWLVPHFEKMLYDNALLTTCYADAYRVFGDKRYAKVVRETLDYVLRDMTNELGAFYSTEDADSEGEEGKFYVWSKSEVEQVLGSAAARFCQVYDVTDTGNFEGHNILNLPRPIAAVADDLGVELSTLEQELANGRKKLFEHRAKRVRPGLDDKVLLSWNALMITAMVRGYRATENKRYLESAQRAVGFIREEMLQENGTLWHAWRGGKAHVSGYLDDYAYLIDALCELFQVDPTAEHLQLACSLADVVLKHFVDPRGGFYFTPDNAESLIARSKDLSDSSVPSANAMAASGFLTLSRLTGRATYYDASESALLAASGVMSQSPQAAGQSLRALRRFKSASEERILVISDSDNHSSQHEWLPGLYRPLRPSGVQLGIEMSDVTPDLHDLCPLLEGRQSADESLLYVCRDSVCELPLAGDDIAAALLK